MAARWTLERARELFESRGCKLLETEYKNDSTQMRYVATCGHIRSSSLNNFSHGKGDLCPSCRRLSNGRRKSLGQDKIRKAFEDEGCRVLSSDFYKQRDPVRYIARCGHENVMDYAHFVQQGLGRMCNRCTHSVLYDEGYVRSRFQEQGCELVEPLYVNCKTPLKYRAACGHLSVTTFDVFMNGTGRTNLCSDCFRKYCAVHPDRVDLRHSPEVTEWRLQVFCRDDYTCQKCGERGGRLEAHHLNGWDHFIDERFSVDNGVTLCEECHKLFHQIYGRGGNTKDQFQAWVEGNTEVSAGPNTL